MRIAITGGTGLVGKALASELIKQNHQVLILTRTAKGAEEKHLSYIQWLSEGSNPVGELKEVDAIVNLAGESISSGRWTEKQKQRILKSRLEATEEVLSIIKKLDKKPKVLINASAVGFYGTSETELFTEEVTTPGNDFLANTVKLWEQKSLEAIKLGVRTVLCRFGIILDNKEGALPRMVLPYKLFAGGTIGTGEQWVSWIHLEDVIKGIIFTIEKEDVHGPVNFTAPNPLKMKEFGKTIGAVLNRPHWIPVPSFVLRILLGEMSILVLEGQKVHPEKLLQAGFHFRFNRADEALHIIFRKQDV